MPVISFQVPDFLSLYGADIDRDELTSTLPMLGGDLDGVDGDTVDIEYFPDRPDLVSVEGIARAMRAFMGVEPGLKEYTLDPAEGRLDVDASVAKVRPWIVMCRVDRRGPIDDAQLKELMDFQERLGNGIGRRRKRVAIGIHDAADVKGPFRYTTVGGDHRFHPLQGDSEMSVTEILTAHPKGKAFAHLLPPEGPYPIILDADGHVLSLPPVINGTRTELREGTTDLILDLTGPDLGTIRTAMAILATAFMERGARVVPFAVHYPNDDVYGDLAGGTLTSPRLEPRAGSVRVSETERVLGFGLGRDEMVTCLARLGHAARPDEHDADLVTVSSPAWRADLLHEWDLIEDVAKGYGYGNVPDEVPQVPTHGKTHPAERRARLARTALVGHGFLEATTLTISNDRDQFDNFGLARPEGDVAAVALTNPITEDHTSMRVWLTPSLFGLLASNKHRDHPQALFEVGQVVDPERGHKNAWRLAAVRADSRFGFTHAKSLAEALLADLGIDSVLEEDDHPAFIAGRAARFVDKDGVVIGRFGEFHPRVVDRYELKVPVAGIELDLDRALPLGHPST